MWQNEELNKKVVEYVRENVSVKGCPHHTTVPFCKWVNEFFLLNCNLGPGIQQNISLEMVWFGSIISALRYGQLKKDFHRCT